jgi:hypothetical protein
MRATVETSRQGLRAIVHTEQIAAAKKEDLELDNRKVLITRGHDLNATVGIIYREFARRPDQTGESFKFSKEKRGLIEIDPLWKQPRRLTTKAMGEYIESWFALCELVSVSGREVLILVDKLPAMFCHVLQQSKRLAPNAEFFVWAD